MSGNKNWIERVMWLEEEYLSELPTVIAYEYSRVKKLLTQDKEVYGALIKLKDVLEITIKFYVSSGLSILHNQANKDERAIKLLYEITEKELSLGDWACAASIIAKLDFDEPLCSICREIASFCFDNKGPMLVKWRNQTLGHGALRDASTAEYANDFLQVLDTLNSFYVDYIEEIKKIRFELHVDSSIINLCGDDIKFFESKEFENCSDVLFVRSKYTDKTVSLYPFVIVVNREVFFFDSVLLSKNRSEFLNYRKGLRETYKKNTDIGEVIFSLHDLYGKSLNTINLINNNPVLDSAEEDYMMYVTEENLKNKYLQDDSVSIISLQEWLEDRISKNDCGLFIVRGKSGSGKTTCMKQIERSQFPSKKYKGGRINLNEVTPKVLYLSTAFNRELSWIIQDIERLFGYSEIKGMPPFPKDVKKTERKLAFAEYMKSVHDVLKKYYLSEEKLLLVIDGIDEMSSSVADELLSYIPRQNELQRNEYILLTCRSSEEIPENLQEKLKQLSILPENSFRLDDGSSYNDNMKNYIEQELGSNQDEDYCRNLIEFSQNRFSYLHFIINAKKLKYPYGDENYTVGQFDIDTAIEKYFDFVRQVYSTNYIDKFENVLVLLLNSRVALTLKNISVLIGESRISFELIGILQDMLEFVSTDRLNGEKYFINKSSLSELLYKHVEKCGIMDAALRRLYQKWGEWLQDILEESEKLIEKRDVEFLTELFSLDFFPDDANKYLFDFNSDNTMVGSPDDGPVIENPFFENLTGKKLFALYIQIKVYELTNETKLPKEFYDAVFDTLIPLDVCLKVKKAYKDNDLLSVLFSKSSYKHINEYEKYDDLVFQFMGFRLFESQINWRNWLIKQYYTDRVYMLNNEQSELNKCYSWLYLYVEDESLRKEFAAIFLQALTELNQSLIHCYSAIGNRELELKYREKYIELLEKVKRMQYDNQQEIKPNNAFLYRMQALYLINNDEGKASNIGRYGDKKLEDSDKKWLDELLKLKMKYDIETYRYLDGAENSDYEKYVLLSQSLKEEIKKHIGEEQYYENTDFVNCVIEYINEENRVLTKEYKADDIYRKLMTAERVFEIQECIPEESKVFSWDNKMVSILEYAFDSIITMQIDNAKRVYDKYLSDYHKIEKKIKAMRAPETTIDIYIGRLHKILYLLWRTFEKDIRIDETIIAEYHAPEKLIYEKILVDEYKNGRRISIDELKNHFSKNKSIQQKTQKKIYPNDPCPCGSGKKYKKCHGMR